VAITPPRMPNGNLIKERIGVYGPPDAGKTHMFFTLAKWHHDLGSKARFYGINTDTSWDVLYCNPEFSELPNIEWTEVLYFQEYIDAAKKYHKMLTPEDWLSVDLMPMGWSATQNEYARILTKSKSGKKLEDVGDLWEQTGVLDEYPIKGWDWGMPNARYQSLANNYILMGPGHRFLMYGEKKLLKESESGRTKEADEVTEIFGHVGYKPDGQKDDPFRYHTFLRVQGIYGKNGKRAHKVTTAKERWGNRRRLGVTMQNNHTRGEKMEDFFLDYLVGVAGWQMS